MGARFRAQEGGSVGSRWSYRLQQGLSRLRALLQPPDLSPAERLLSSQAFTLFQRMGPGDRAHCLRVLDLLQEEGVTCPDLLKAALLHDVGKAEGNLTLAYRTVIVLVRRFRPAGLERLAHPRAGHWRYPFWVHLHHAELGAARCAQVGCSPQVTALVRYHEAAPETIADEQLCIQLALLAAADDRC
jgi:hypothetical protein